MTERLPYEEQLAQQWNDLPLPDENMAWEDMKRRLDEDEDSGIIPIWLRGCGFWVLLALIVLIIGFLWLRPDKWNSKKEGTESVITIEQKDNSSKNNVDSNNDGGQLKTNTGAQENKIVKADNPDNKTPDSAFINSTSDQINRTVKNKADISVSTQIPVSKKKRTGGGKEITKTVTGKDKKQNEKEQVDIAMESPVKTKDSNNTEESKTKLNEPVDNSISKTAVPSTKPDSVVQKISTDSTTKKDSIPAGKTNEVKKDSSKSKSISFSAGLGMSQLIPIDGQKLNPYNSAGRKGSIADYIPSVFGRMYIGDKWFLQAEFRYGAPQYNKEFLYQQQSVLDTIGPINNHTIITSKSLKKTFYHQLPFTVNYFILPDWSMGTGVVWNKFVSAISQQEVNRKNNTTLIDSIISNSIIKDKGDTVFKKSYLQVVLETQYQWRRFSFGMKYSFGLQPYIRFSLPGGPPRGERNKSFQLFLRYELWRSKKKF